MKTEFEAKFYPTDKEMIRQKLAEVGAQLVCPERLMKRAIAGKEINPQIQSDYIRVRDEGDSIRISAKVHAAADGEVSDQKEIDITVSKYDEAIELLEYSGLTFNTYQENLRETWELERAEVVIDTWPGLETYIEIEGESEEHVKAIAEKLGKDWDKKRITSISPVYAEVYGVSIEEAIQRLRYITFEQVPFGE